MSLFIDKVRLALGGKKTVATALGLIIFQLASAYGLDIDPKLQEQITIILAALIAIFMRIGVQKSGPKD